MMNGAQVLEKKQFGHAGLYEQMQQDALMLIESYGFSISTKTAGKIFNAMPSDQAALVNYSEDMGRIYIPADTIELCLERIRQDVAFWPKGFGTGGMAAYIVDDTGPRSPVSEDMKRLATLYGQTDLLTSLQSSFNVCNSIKRNDMATRGRVECQAIDDMIASADGKLIMPTVLSDAAYDHLKTYQDKGHKVGAALSIVSTYMTVSDEMVDPFLKTVTRGLPFIMNSMPIGGLTGPYSMTALATLAQAEALFGMVLGQLITPGIKCLNSAMPTIADMSQKDMPMMFGSIANTMINILLAELNISLGIPCCQSSCSHHRDNLDDAAEERSIEIFNLINQYDYFIMRHMFGFSAQLNDFKIENMEKQIALYKEVLAHPTPVDLPLPAQYDDQGMEAIFEGMDRRDFRVLDHTLQNIGISFTR
ncbi:MAG: trimethylamine methyltransferase family protein [Desulfobacterium sp.]|nr:trimethylamine methyltransferase family protein [Desulfobacterium sp.]